MDIEIDKIFCLFIKKKKQLFEYFSVKNTIKISFVPFKSRCRINGLSFEKKTKNKLRENF